MARRRVTRQKDGGRKDGGEGEVANRWMRMKRQ